MNNEDRRTLYDFPVSYAFRAYEAELNGECLPPIEPLEPQLAIEFEAHHIPVEPQVHMTRIRRLEEDLEGLRNYVIRKKQEPKMKGDEI